MPARLSRLWTVLKELAKEPPHRAGVERLEVFGAGHRAPKVADTIIHIHAARGARCRIDRIMPPRRPAAAPRSGSRPLLAQAGYTTLLQAWDFRPGGGFLHQMQQATSTATRTIAVLSPAYFGSELSEAEWRAALCGLSKGR
jgi:hypothetical protein